jgi:hypothetical protein
MKVAPLCLVPVGWRFSAAEKIPHLPFDILRDPYRTLPFHVPDDLCHRIFGKYRNQHVDVIRHQMALLDTAFLAARELSCRIAVSCGTFGVNTTWYLHSQVA